MIGFSIWVFSFWWAYGPNDYHLTALLEGSDALEHQLLPLEQLSESVSPLWIVSHGRPDWPSFFFVSEQNWTARAGFGFMLGTERFLPGLQAPRLLVSRDYLVDGKLEKGFRPLEPLAIDESNAFFRALLEVRLARAIKQLETVAQFVDRRSDELMGEVPADARRAAYLHAQTDYGAHLLSIGHEIGRHQRRKEQGSMCALLKHPATLFGFWQRTVLEGAYPGLYTSKLEPGDVAAALIRSNRGAARMTEAVLEAQDKVWMAEKILGTNWSGDPSKDFVMLCGALSP